MREIKFRAWDKSTGVMIGADAWFFSDSFEPFVDSVESAKRGFKIMQYTGLKDKNGKEIYEGDIVRSYDIDYPDGMTAYTQEIVEEVKYEGGAFQSICTIPSEEFEIIGNIYENPELLV